MMAIHARRLPIAICLLALTGWSPGALAQDEGIQALKEDQRNFTLDLTPPDLSAFALLGMNPTEVARPGTVRELAAAVANGYSPGGQINPGVALEWAPGQTFGAASSLDEYRRTALWRRIAVSLATAADGPAVRTAAGLRWVLRDDTDPRSNLQLAREIELELAGLSTAAGRKARTEALVSGLKQLLGPGSEATVADLLEKHFNVNPPDGSLPVISSRAAYCKRVKRAIEVGGKILDDQQSAELCALVGQFEAIVEAERAASAGRNAAEVRLTERLQAFREAAWNANILEVALGATGIAADGSWSALEVESLRAYAAMGMGFGAHGQAIMKLDGSRFVSGPDRWILAFGLRGLIGTPDGRGTLEVAGRSAENSPDSLRIAVGGEIRVGRDLWLELLVGDDGPTGDLGEGRLVWRANLKYGEPQKPTE